MIIIAGLGNPDKKYEHTRHNLGFRVLDLVAGGAEWEDKYDSKLIKLKDVLLVKPQSFMNNSGKALKQIFKFYPDSELIVIHDDLDFPLGSLKIMKNISSAGHNGVQNIIDELSTQDFIRIRLGIDNPETRGQIPGEDYVLQKFTEKEEKLVTEVIDNARDAIEIIQTSGIETAQSRFNG
ncbi:MAG: aminoacyl-tRNA hydrolase [bacterium]|nr:aminoacyl-tRNA hydrolase [bacterium]